MEPIINEKYFRNDGLRTHFPKMNQTSSSSNILCQNCTENQQKIIQLLLSFEVPNSLSGLNRRQYEDYAAKLDKRYPLCATCTYRVQVQLKKCDEDAALSERRHTAQSGEDWQNKLKLAQKMKWTHMKRKIIKGIFFWPDFLFQLLLTLKCVMKSQTKEHQFTSHVNVIEFGFISDKNMKIWLPNTLNLPSFFFVFVFLLFSIQFHGIATGTGSFAFESFTKICPQLFLLISRCFIGNFLYRCDKSVLDLNSILTLTAVGLAIIFKTGSRNALINRNIFRRSEVNKFISNSQSQGLNEPIDSALIFSTKTNRSNSRAFSPFLSDKKGFAAYSDNHHTFHSFANQVPENVPKPIMPWPDKPLPSNAFTNQNEPFRKFNENLNNNFNGNGNNSNVTMRPTKLDVCDPLELEPMFSSFSLRDEPTETKPVRTRRVNTVSNKQSAVSVENTKSVGLASTASTASTSTASTATAVTSVTPTLLFKKISNQEILRIGYNCLLTTLLAICRISLLNSPSSLVTIILALTFGLRGFIWPRLTFKIQLFTLIVAVGRLAWLGAEIHGKLPMNSFNLIIGYLALSLDLILIILR